MTGAWDVVADALGFGPSGNDHASSNWAAWGHEEICSMLQTSVDPGDIDDAARAWRNQGRHAEDLVTGLTRDLQGIVFGGWRGAAADAALTALGPVNRWSAEQADTADRTTQLMDDSASSTAQAKSAVPPPKPHDWNESLRSFAIGGGAGVFVDAVAQEQEKLDAHAEAVRVMTSVYSAPINDHRAAVPIYPQLADPTVQPPEQSPDTGPVPGTLYSATAGPATGGPATGAHISGGSGTGGPFTGTPGGGSTHGGGHVASPPPATATLQGVSSDPAPPRGGRSQHLGEQIAAAAAAAGVPIVAPIAESRIRRALAPGGGVRLGGAGAGGVHPSGGGVHIGGEQELSGRASTGEFGPRPSGAAAEAAQGRIGRGAGAGDLMAPMGARRGKEGDDSEHRRPSYLIEMDDIFTDGRKVAPAVIGADPAEQ
ncbi:MAG: WXG100 family type VII secretion target, partial [Pseudonocardiaceae bacterium]